VSVPGAFSLQGWLCFFLVQAQGACANAIAAKLDGFRIRTNKVHVTNVGWVEVLKENEYNMEQGMTMEAVTKHRKSTAVHNKKGSKFEHDDYCFNCDDGGEMICCSRCDHIITHLLLAYHKALIALCYRCPRVFHLECVGLKQLPSTRLQWSCPQHMCGLCPPEDARKTMQSSLSMRCVICPASFCFEHLPPKEDYMIVYDWWPFARQGFSLSPKKNYCYITCSPKCSKEARRREKLHDTERAALPDAAEEEAQLVNDADAKAAALQKAEADAKEKAAKKGDDEAAALAKKAEAVEAAKISDAVYRLPIGSSVMIHSLSAQAQYNGLIGIVHRFDESQRRLVVKLNTTTGAGIHLALQRNFIAQMGLKVELLVPPHEGKQGKIIGADYISKPPTIKLSIESCVQMTATARMEDILFPNGTAVKFVDLVARPHLNGEWGIIKAFDRKADRYTIAKKLDAVMISVKRLNVSL
jgi:hypothetical protein